VTADWRELYETARADLHPISEPLFGFAEQQVLKRGIFLPFGAIMDVAGNVQLQAAAGEHELTNSVEILPLLHQGLRSSMREDTRAVAVCEWVKITPPGSRQTDAIKVLVEHSNGLAIAFYLPMRKKLLGSWEYGDLITMPAQHEVIA
jgi:hypothetical protein